MVLTKVEVAIFRDEELISWSILLTMGNIRTSEEDLGGNCGSQKGLFPENAIIAIKNNFV